MIACAAVVAFGVGAAIVWYVTGWNSVSAISFENPRDSSAPEKTASLKDFQGLQQQNAQSMRSMEQMLAAQGAEIKRLSDQLALLSGKIDLLQGPAASVNDAIDLAAPPAAVRARPKKSKSDAKKPFAKPAGAFSTGGAPLSTPAQ